jgi:predicted nucleic acid-binding protein
MTTLLDAGQVILHPFVIGELALGNLPERKQTLRDLHDLPQIAVATAEEVLLLIDQHRLFGSGIGYVDAHLIAAIQINPAVHLWTRDKRLTAIADRMAIARVILS